MIENSVCCEVASRWFSEDKAKIWAALSLAIKVDSRERAGNRRSNRSGRVGM